MPRRQVIGPRLRFFERSDLTRAAVTAALTTHQQLHLGCESHFPLRPAQLAKNSWTLARTHTLVPVCRTLMADLETPVSAFLRAAWPERECFLLESVEGGEQVGRYTFIGLTPFKRIVARGREIAITEGRKTTHIEGDIFAVLRDALSGHKPARLPGLPPFTAGAVGYFAYDAVRQIERLPALAKDELTSPTPACSSSMRCWPSTMCARRSCSWSRRMFRGAPPRQPTIAPSSVSTGWKSASRSRFRISTARKPRKPAASSK